MTIKSYYKFYFLNRQRKSKVIHIENCSFFPESSNCIYVGFYASYVPALYKAKEIGFENARLCSFCCKKNTLKTRKNYF